MRSISKSRRLGVVGGSLLLLGSLATFAGSRQVDAAGPCSGTTCTVTFGYTGGDQTWTVPAGITSATFDVYGAQGGAGNMQAGGEGGEVLDTLSVTPGDVFEIVVGAQGGGLSFDGYAGFNGGGAGGQGGASNMEAGVVGAGGGGASDVRTGSCAATASCADSDRILVGGGGGGSVGTGGSESAPGGAGENPSGVNGGTNGSQEDATGGGGGTQSAPGPHGDVPETGACLANEGPTNGADATGADGGAGGNGEGSPTAPNAGNGGGGGGGGYFGGGGGGGASCQGVSGGGGGGSSFGAGATFDNGVQDGNGAVVITYTAAQTTMTSTAVPNAGSTGSTLQDSATLTNTGTLDGTGSITFNLYGAGDAGCSASPVYSTTVSDINGNGPWSTTAGNNTSGYDATGVGTYNWTASFTGDSANDPASTACGDGPVVIKALLTISTTASPSTGPTASTLQDSATLTNAATLDGTGSITFNLYAPGDTTCASPVHSETVNGISSDGPFGTTTGYTATAIGTYDWTATFSGDGNNAGAATSCGAEPVVITRAGISQITPTSATCSQFTGLTAHTLAQVTYSMKSGKVKTAAPDGFLDWVKVTSTGGTQTFTVTQSVNETSRFFMLASGSTAYTASCAKVSVTTAQSNGRVTVKFNGGSAGATYYIALKYSTSNVIGETGPSPNSKVAYQFTTTGVAGSQRELDLVS